MVRVARRIEPIPTAAKQYNRVYRNYRFAGDRVSKISHLLATSKYDVDGHDAPLDSSRKGDNQKHPIIMPSLLSADFGSLSEEARNCLAAGANWIHVDVCDGGTACGGSLTLGPQSIAAMRRACPTLNIGKARNIS